MQRQSVLQPLFLLYEMTILIKLGGYLLQNIYIYIYVFYCMCVHGVQLG